MTPESAEDIRPEVAVDIAAQLRENIANVSMRLHHQMCTNRVALVASEPPLNTFHFGTSTATVPTARSAEFQMNPRNAKSSDTANELYYTCKKVQKDVYYFTSLYI
jgi:hypothetical protein